MGIVRNFISMSAAALLGLSAGLAGLGTMPPPSLAYRNATRMHRSRTPGKPRPAGAKLARLAYERRIGIATIR